MIDTVLDLASKTSDEIWQEIAALKEEIRLLYAEIEYLKSSEKEFNNSCVKAKLSQRDTLIAHKYYVEHNTPKEIWLWLCQHKEYDAIEWDSVYQLLWRIGKKLKNAKNL